MSVHRLQVQREEKKKDRDTYKRFMCLVPYRFPTISSAYIQLNMQQHLLLYDLKGSRRYRDRRIDS
jgi:hypothetical protein